MESDGISSIILLVIFIFLSAFFSSSETALMSLNKLRIRHLVEAKVKNAILVEKLIDNPNKLLSTILICNTVVNVAASSIMTSYAIKNLGGTGVGIATGVLTILLLIFGEIAPKSFAASNSEKLSLKIIGIISVIVTIMTPIVWLLGKITNLFIRTDGSINNKLITEEEFKTIVDVSQEEGVLEVGEKEMIYNVFQFGDQQIKDIMIPRTDVTSIDVDSKYEELIELIQDEHYSRFPVYRENIDNIIGILNVKDLIGIKHEEKEIFNVEKYMREAFYTYEYKKIGELFTEMKKRRAHMSIVMDEYGGTAGIVTIEDIVEEIVGDIEDEYDEGEDDIKVIKEDEYVVDGSTRIEEVNEMIGTKFESEDFDSIGGFIIGILGKIPNQGEVVEFQDTKFVIEEVENNRIKSIRIFT